jgi:hypothetical protein
VLGTSAPIGVVAPIPVTTTARVMLDASWADNGQTESL